MHTLIIHCGGTLGMVKSNTGLHTETGHLQNLLIKSHKISKFNISIHELDKIIDSSIATTQDWLQIIQIIEKNYKKYSGFVIIHGTDTMAYASSFLTYMIKINKPIVFTGAIVPMCINYESAETNIIDALKVAENIGHGVFFQFGGMLFNGDRVTKVSTISEQAFVGSYYPLNASFYPENIFYMNHANDIAVLKLYPNIQDNIVKCILMHTKYLIIESYGTGNGLDDRINILNMIEEIIISGGLVINVSQCHGTCVDWTYSSSRGMARVGVLSGKKVTTECAFAILAFVVGNYKNEERKEKVLEFLDLYQ